MYIDKIHPLYCLNFFMNQIIVKKINADKTNMDNQVLKNQVKDFEIHLQCINS